MPAGKRIPAAVIRALWLDGRLTTAEAAARAGLSRSTLWRRARALGLPPRKEGRRFEIGDLRLFARMWAAGLHGPAMAAHFGFTYSAIRATARRLGLGPRRLGHRPRVSMGAFLEAELAARLAVTAQASNARLRAMLREAA